MNKLCLVACFFGLPLLLWGQIDASTLRAKYGLPLARETFQVRPDIEAIVDYGPGHQVCRIELRPGNSMNIVREASPRFVTLRQVDEVIDELVPPSVRGKEKGRSIESMRRAAVSVVVYEYVNIAEPQDPNHLGARTGVTITFTRIDCNAQFNK
jgi:hypothetical protein